MENVIFQNYAVNYGYGVLNTLGSNQPFSEKMRGIYRTIFTSEPEETYRMLKNNDIDIIHFFNQFKKEYGAFFNIFETQSKFIGTHLGLVIKKQLQDLYVLYGLTEGGPSSRTPIGFPMSLNKMLIELIHIKNGAISHSNYDFKPFLNSSEVIIWDVNKKGVETFRKSYTKRDLYDIIYTVIMLSRGIQRAALYFSFILRIVEVNHNSKRGIECPRCKHKDEYTITANKKKVKCKKCSFVIRVRS